MDEVVYTGSLLSLYSEVQLETFLGFCFVLCDKKGSLGWEARALLTEL